MRLRIAASVCLSICFVAAVLIAQDKTADPLSGVWFGDYGTSPRDREQVQVAFMWDGKVLIGSVRTGDEPIEMDKATFDPATGALHFELTIPANARSDYHYMVDGKLDKDTITGTWRHEAAKGDFSIKKIG
jgi:hypothetical protein